MRRRGVGYGLLILSAGIGVSLLWSIGTFTSNAVLLHVLATTGGDYGIAWGSWKLSGPSIDTVQDLSRSEVYVRGESNPWPIDYDTMFDYFVVEGEVIGVDHVSGKERYPLMKVSQWTRIRWTDFLLRKWFSILGLAVSFSLLWQSRRKGSLRH